MSGKSNKLLKLTAAEKLRRLQNKRKQEEKAFNKDEDKENDQNLENQAHSKYESLAENLAGMMDKIASQLDIITRTVVTLEKRIGDNEELANQAYDLYKNHQRQSLTKAERIKEQEEKEIQQVQVQDQEEVDSGHFPSNLEDLAATREKAKNIMKIINISQYSLAAVQKSADQIKDTTTHLKEKLDGTAVVDMNPDTPIQEESEDDLERDV